MGAFAVSCRFYSVKDGLSENTVRCIMQDKDGYMWFGTKFGLNKFNGHEFESYGFQANVVADDTGQTFSLNVLDIIQHKDGRRIWIAARDGVLLFEPDAGTFTALKYNGRILTGGLSLCYDADGKLWVGTGSGLFIYDEDNDSLIDKSRTTAFMNINVSDVFCDSAGSVWVGSGCGLYRYNRMIDDFVFVEGTSDDILCISEDENSTIWVGTWYSGFAKVNKIADRLQFFKDIDLPRVRDIWHESDRMWLCSDIGLYVFDKSSKTLEKRTVSPEFEHNSVYKCFRDREGSLWVGTYFNGVGYISSKYWQMEAYSPGSAVSEFCETVDGRILVATENGGLYLFDPEKRKFEYTPYHNQDDNIHAVAEFSDELWLGTFSKGLRRIDYRTGNVRTYTESTGEIPDNHVYSIHKSHDGKNIYIGTMHGCSVFGVRDGAFTRVDALKKSFIYDITEDRTGRIWFADYGGGLHCYDSMKASWKNYRHIDGDTTSLSSNRVIRLCRDAQDRLYVCTEGGGVSVYDYSNDCFYPLFSQVGKYGYMARTVVFGIMDDSKGRLWMTTNHGMYRYDPSDNSLRQYTYEDGLLSNQFNYRSTLKSSDGKFYVGGINGFNVFRPNEIKDNLMSPEVTLSVSFSNPKNGVAAIIKLHGSDSKEIETIDLPRGLYSFKIGFECLSFVAPAKNRWAYMLRNDGEWVETSQKELSFIDLHPGCYDIRVRAINGDNVWSESECRMELHVRPHLLMSLGAKSLYGLLLFLMLIFFAYKWLEWRNDRVRQRIDEMEALQKQEAYDAKIMFFTQIAHEIKTPLSLIKAPLEIIQDHRKWDAETEENIDIVKKNTDRLVELVGQLLDFKKINRDGYSITRRNTDLCPLIKSVVGNFDGVRNGSLDIRLELPEDEIFADVDAEAFKKIVSNLVSNAVKYTSDTIFVSLSQVSDVILMSVRDNGEGIPPEEREKIFETFYQIEEQEVRWDDGKVSGIGLGLSLVKTLVEKHGGKVYINGEFMNGCEICVEIPRVGCSHIDEEEILSDEEDRSVPVKEDNGVNLLIVEDNAELTSFLESNLSSNYAVSIAENGVKALDILEKTTIDVVVSDIVMPDMDGLALLEKVRGNPLICHIPFILLTAENSLESKISGLEKGADAYIEKPFSMIYLRAVIENVLNTRAVLQKRLASEPLGKYSPTVVVENDAKLLQKINNVILDNLTEDTFSVNALAAEFNMCRSNFQRKLKGLTGIAPNDYIRIVRLKRAAELLSEGVYRINEVCYMTGFSNPSYFAKCFYQYFGMLPKEFVQSLTLEKEKSQSVDL